MCDYSAAERPSSAARPASETYELPEPMPDDPRERFAVARDDRATSHSGAEIVRGFVRDRGFADEDIPPVALLGLHKLHRLDARSVVAHFSSVSLIFALASYFVFPTQKPLEIIERMVKASCPPGGVVLDPFMGSGTTAVAARRCGRQFVGFELNDAYCALIAQRLADESPLPLSLNLTA